MNSITCVVNLYRQNYMPQSHRLSGIGLVRDTKITPIGHWIFHISVNTLCNIEKKYEYNETA